MSFNPSWESRPSGTPLAIRCISLPLCFNPSWESRPSGTTYCHSGNPERTTSFNPSWESRPSGTSQGDDEEKPDETFQPLMGEPSLWNDRWRVHWTPCRFGFNPSWESRPSGTGQLHRSHQVIEATFQPLMGEPSLWNGVAVPYETP